jgi:hypothetical protein
VAYLALTVAGLTHGDATVVRAVYPSMELIGWFVLIPLSLATLATGLIQGLGTVWGLFRYYWVSAKLLIAVGASTVLVIRAGDFFGPVGTRAAESPSSGPPLETQLLVHAVGGLLLLLAATVLSVFKPWGRTPYGQRKLDESRVVVRSADSMIPAAAVDLDPSPVTGHPMRASARRGLYVVIAITVIALVFIGMHLAGGGRVGH